MTRNTKRRGAAALGLPLAGLGMLGLAGCATVPPVTGPMVISSPPQGKAPERFQQEDAFCRQQAFAAIGGLSPQQAAGNAAVGSAAVGTAVGAAAGALLGAAAGNPGAGAAIGAGTGLVAGSAIGAGNAQAAGYGAQAAYDASYGQCMTAYGNTVQAAMVPPAGAYVAGAYPYAVPYATPYPYYGYAAPYYAAPSVTLGLGYGWGWGGWYRPWGYGWGGGWGYRPYGGWYAGRGWYGGGYGGWGGGYRGGSWSGGGGYRSGGGWRGSR
jgi:hypothetical protein